MNKLKKNMILYNNLIYILEKLHLYILIRYHEKPTARHIGIKRNLELITRYFWWPKIHEDIKKFLNSCETCARNKKSGHRKYGLFQKSLEINRNSFFMWTT